MWLAGFGYWVVGFDLLAPGFHTSLGGLGIWIGLAFALATVALVMVLWFERLTRRRGIRADTLTTVDLLDAVRLAHAFEEQAGELTAKSACEAYVSFRKRSNRMGPC